MIDPSAATGALPGSSGIAARVAPSEVEPTEPNGTLGQGLVECPAESGANYCLPLLQRPYLKVDGAFASPGHQLWYRVRVTASAGNNTKFGIACGADSAIPGVNPARTDYGYGSIFVGVTGWTAWTRVAIPATETRTCGVINGWNSNGTTYEAQVRAIYPTTGLVECPANTYGTYCLPSAYRWYETVDGGFPSPGHRVWYRVNVTASSATTTKFGIVCADAGIPGIQPAGYRPYGYGSINVGVTSGWTGWAAVDIPASETGTCGVKNGWNEPGTTYEAQVTLSPVRGLAACPPADEATYCVPLDYRPYATVDGGFPSPRGLLWYRVHVTQSQPYATKFGIGCEDSGIPGVFDDPTDVRLHGYASIDTGPTAGWTAWFAVELPVSETGTCGVVNGWNDAGATYEAQVRVDGISTEQLLGTPDGLHGNTPNHLAQDPVNTATGNYVSTVTDLALPGRGLALAFTRTYNSLDTADGSLGPGWRHNHSAELIINPDSSVTFVAENGARLEFSLDGSGGFETPPGGTSSLTAISGGYELVRRDQVRYGFDAAGQLTSLTDRNDNTITFAYAAGELATISDTVGRTVTLTHDAQGRLTQLVAPLSTTVTYAYNAAGLLSAVTDRRGGVTEYTYDASNRLLTVVDANDHTLLTNEYGADGRISGQTDARGEGGTFAWDPVTHTSTYTDARGGVWLDIYAGNALRRQVDPLGNVISYAYDEQFNMTAVTDPRGNTTTMTYDADGNLLTRTAPEPLSHVETFTYNTLGDVLTATDGRANTTSYGYDAAGNLVTITEPGSAVTTLARDSAGTGLLTATTDPRGKTTSLAYDDDANVISTSDPLGNVTTMTYDALSRLTSRVDPRGNLSGADPDDFRTGFTYDGDLLASTTDPLGNALTTTYDAVGNRLTVTDPLGNTTAYTYGAANHLLTVTDADANTTTYAYDAVGNLVTRTDAKNQVTAYAYDLGGRLTSTTDPLGNDWLLGYDPAGNLLTRVDARDQPSTYAFDVLNRPTGINYGPAGTPDVGYAYDAAGNLIQLTDGAGTEAYAYDSRNRLTSVTRGADTFTYAYDSAGNLTSRTDPAGQVTTYAYDDDGRMSSVVVDAATTAYAYDAAGNLIATATPDGLTATHSYDEAGRLLEVAHVSATETLSRFTYGLDAAGRRTNVTTTLGATGFAYDDRGQLIEACFAECPGETPVPELACRACVGDPLERPSPQIAPDAADTFVTYAYDSVGNRLSHEDHLGTTTYSYDAADRLTTLDGPSTPPEAYTYDANGNQTAADADTFAWDAADRLTSATVDTATYIYTYAGDGRRLSATSGGAATQFVWDIAFSHPMLTGERDGTGATLRSYAYGLDLLSQSAAGVSSYYHPDGLGSAVDLTDPTGAPLAWAEYAPFGDARYQASATGAPSNPFGFAGEYRDPTGLYHLRARQYDPMVGRFLSQDPVASLLGDPYVASYVYVRNAPQDFADPSGRVWETPAPGSSPFPSAVGSPTTRPSPSHAPPLIPGPIPTPPPGWSPQPAPQGLPPQLPIRACDQAQWAISWGLFGAGAVQAIQGLRGGRGPIDVFLGGVGAAGGLIGVVDSLTGCEL